MAKGDTAAKAERAFLPIVIDSAESAKAVDEAERVAVFSVDGVEYTMSSAPRADIALTYLEMSEGGDAEGAAYYLLTETLGLEAYAALKGVKGLSDKQFEGVQMRVQAVALPKGKAPQSMNKRR